MRPLTSARNYAILSHPKRQCGGIENACNADKATASEQQSAENENQRIESHARRKSGSRRLSGSAGTAPLRLVAVNFAFRAARFRNPPVLLRYGSSSQKVLRYFLGALLVFPCSFGVACAWLRRAKPAALVYDKHTPRCQIKFPIHRLLKSCSIYELLLSLFSIEKNTCSWYNIKAHEKSVHCQHFSF